MGRKLEASAAMVAMATAAAVHGQTRVIYVDQSAPSGGDGGSWETAFTNLRDAIEEANALPESRWLELRVAQGVYRAGGTAFADRPILQPTATASGATLRILGSFGGRRSPSPDARDYVTTPTILSGDLEQNDTDNPATREDNAFSLLEIYWDAEHAPNSLDVDGLVFRDAGRLNMGIALLLSSRAYRNLISNCQFLSNCGWSGPALSADLYNWVSVVNCSFIDNAAVHDGGAVHTLGAFEASDCTFSRNSAGGDGGVMFGGWIAGSGSASFSRCVLTENRAGRDGGAIYARAPSIYVANSLLAGNSAERIGGAGYFGGVAVVSSTIVDNTSAWGGALAISGDSWLEGALVYGNTATADGSQCVVSEADVVVETSLVEGGINGFTFGLAGRVVQLAPDSLLNVDPEFKNWPGVDHDRSTTDDNDYRLSPRSRAIDASAYFGDEPDLNGNPRKVPGLLGRPPLPDLGCYESQITLCPADMDADDAVGVDDLVIYLRAFEDGDLLADIVTSASDTRPDTAVTIDDLVYFLSRFEAGC